MYQTLKWFKERGALLSILHYLRLFLSFSQSE